MKIFNSGKTILDTEIHSNNILKSVRTGNFKHLEVTEISLNAKDDENKQKIENLKDKIKSNLTLLDLGKIKEILKKKESDDELKKEENITDICIKDSIIGNQVSNQIESNLQKKNTLEFKCNMLKRRQTHKFASPKRLTNSLLQSNNNSNYFSNNKFGSKENINNSNPQNVNSSSYTYYNNSNSNSNNNSINGLEEIHSLKSSKLMRLKSNSQNLMKSEKSIFQKQNSHISYKSNSSNKNSVFTLKNNNYFKDKESSEIGSSILEVNFIIFNI